ncbi:MAG TPA: hypothetical protein VHC70_12255 [Phycisphaerales bacterium]|jgi:predicted  nucleic acid-binding Zn-ribbon protein|nr:hypothetical protein [Phycisphaerales bacterium]
MAEPVFQQTPPPRNAARGPGAGIIALCIAAGLLLGAGVMTPFVISWRNDAKEAQQRAIAEAERAEQNKQEAIALEKQKSEMRENLGAAQKAIDTLKTDLSARESALGELKKVDTQRASEIETLKADIAKKSADMTDLDTRLKSARAEVESATQQSADLSNKINGLRGDVSRLSETVQVKDAEIAKLVAAVKTEQQAKQVAIAEAQQARVVAAENEAKAVAAHHELMTLAPLRIEERHATKTGRKLGEKSGFPFAAALDPLGDAFQGIGEGLFGKSGPVILVAVYKDGHEETLSKADAAKWQERGIRIAKLKS